MPRYLSLLIKVLQFDSFNSPPYSISPPYYSTLCIYAITSIFLHNQCNIMLVSLHEKPQWRRLNHSHPLLQMFWNTLSCHLSSISALPASDYRKRLKHHLFFKGLRVLYPSISSPSGNIKLSDVTPFTNVPQVRNIMSPS